MNEFNKILGRDFIIAFLLPALFFLVGSFFCLKVVHIETAWLNFDLKKPLEDSTILALEAFVLGVFLQSVNREIFRFAEGYWWSVIPSWLNSFQRRRFLKLDRDIAALRAEKNVCQKKSKPFERQPMYDRLSEQAVTEFPREHLVLPTTFGNVVRAYEDYPRVVYGFESIKGWPRIQALLSKQAAETLSQTRARVDMWLNFCFVTGGLLVESGFVVWKQLSFLWLLPVSVLFILIAYLGQGAVPLVTANKSKPFLIFTFRSCLKNLDSCYHGMLRRIEYFGKPTAG